MKDIPICPICGGDRKHHFTKTILYKYEVSYYYCNHCGLLQTEEPYWLEEAYASAISDADTGLVSRNVSISEKLAGILLFQKGKGGKYLDMAGGYGMLTRLMRDLGFDFYWWDPYCQNILAKGFDLATVDPPFDAITAFEVLEHVYDPVKFIQESFDKAQTSTIFFSTELFSSNTPLNWYYYTPETGQHISFYQSSTLKYIAKKLSLQVYSCKNFHVLTNERMPIQFKLITSHMSKIIGLCLKIIMISESKTSSDRKKILDIQNQNTI